MEEGQIPVKLVRFEGDAYARIADLDKWMDDNAKQARTWKSRGGDAVSEVLTNMGAQLLRVALRGEAREVEGPAIDEVVTDLRALGRELE